MMGGFAGMSIFGGLWMAFEFVLLLGLLALLVWGASRLFPGEQDKDHATTDPIEILKRRYATGEISQAEFEMAKKALV